jgi:hypothetical protein
MTAPKISSASARLRGGECLEAFELPVGGVLEGSAVAARAPPGALRELVGALTRAVEPARRLQAAAGVPRVEPQRVELRPQSGRCAARRPAGGVRRLTRSRRRTRAGRWRQPRRGGRTRLRPRAAASRAEAARPRGRGRRRRGRAVTTCTGAAVRQRRAKRCDERAGSPLRSQAGDPGGGFPPYASRTRSDSPSRSGIGRGRPIAREKRTIARWLRSHENSSQPGGAAGAPGTAKTAS